MGTPPSKGHIRAAQLSRLRVLGRRRDEVVHHDGEERERAQRVHLSEGRGQSRRQGAKVKTTTRLQARFRQARAGKGKGRAGEGRRAEQTTGCNGQNHNSLTKCIKFSSICTESMVAVTTATQSAVGAAVIVSFLLHRMKKHGVSLTRISLTQELTKGEYYPAVGLGER